MTGTNTPRAKPWRWLAVPAALVMMGAAHAQVADVLLNQSDSPDPGPANGVFTYTYTITNNSSQHAATAVELTITPPTRAGSTVQFVSFDPPAGFSGTCTPDAMPTPPEAPPPSILCAVGTMPPSASAQFQLRVRLPDSGVYDSEGRITSTNDQPGVDNNGRRETTTVRDAADLEALARATDSGGTPITEVNAGQLFNYVLSARNNGPHSLVNNGKLRMRFTVPTGAEAMGAPAGTGWSCTPGAPWPRAAGTVFTCEQTLPAGLAVTATSSELTVPMRATTGTTGGSNFDASFAVSGHQANGADMPDSDASNNTATVPLSAVEGSDMGIAKARTPATGTIVAGSTVTFTLTPSYVAGLPPTGTITVTDTLPAEFTDVTFSEAIGWDCGATSGNAVSCSRPASDFPITPGDAPAITITATATGTATVNNAGTIAVTDGYPDPNPDNDSSTVEVPISDQADLRTTKTASLNPVLVGQPFSYSIRVRNHGPLAIPASGQTVTVRDTPAAGITLFPAATGTSVTLTSGSCVRSDDGAFPLVGDGTIELVCTPNTTAFPVDATGTGWLIAVPAVATTTSAGIANNACVSLAVGVIANPANADCSTVSVRATPAGTDQGADLEVISKVGSPKPVRAGELLTYTILVRNNGPQAATNVTVTDVLSDLLPGNSPTGFESAAITGGTCSPSTATAGTSQTVVCSLTTLAADATATATIVVRPTRATTGNRVNTATIHSPDIGDPDHDNNAKTDTTEVTAVATIDITKTATPDTPVEAGEPVTYTAAITNAGPSTAQGVTLRDELPANAVFIDMVTVPSGNTCTPPAAGSAGGAISCDLGTIATGATKTVTYRVRPAPAPGDDYTDYTMVNVARGNTSTLTTGGVAHPEVSDTTTTRVTQPTLDVLINKTDTPDPVAIGETVAYDVRVENNGPSLYASGAVMVDRFPNTAPGAPSRTALFSYRGNLRVQVGSGDFSPTLPAGMTCTEPAVGVTEGELRCTWPGLDRDIPVTFRYDMRAESISLAGSDSGSGTNWASIAVTEQETEYGNNTTNEDTTTRRTVPAPGSEIDLGIVKTTDAAVAAPGDEFDYTLTVTNHSAPGRDVIAAHGAQVLDTLPAGLSFVSATDCVYAATPRQVVCAVPSLAAGSTTAFTLRVRVDAPYTGARPLNNTAYVDMPADPNPGNNSSTTPKHITPPPGGTTAIPTLSEWGLIVLSLLMAAFALRSMSLQAGRRR